MNESRPDASIVIPCRNEKDHIENCLRSILAQDSLREEFEVIVADGMSDDGTRSILERMAKEDLRLRIVDNSGHIVSTGLNAAIRQARGRVIIRMDAHTEYARDYVRKCLEVLQATGADNVGGPARTKSTNYMQAAISAAFHSPFSTGGAGFHKPHFEGLVDTVTYGCWPREVFDRIGFFDEELVRNQDDEFNLRLTRAGGKIWQSPRIKSWYKPRGSLRSLFTQYLQYGYWKVRVIQKHRMPASWRHLVPGLFVLLAALLPLTSFWLSFALWAWAGLLGSYAICNFSVSLYTAARYDWKLFLVLPLVFACYHIAYGWGFLRGIFDFMILRRGPMPAYLKLSRFSQKSVGS